MNRKDRCASVVSPQFLIKAEVEVRYHFISHLQEFIHTSICVTPMTVTLLPNASHVKLRCELLTEVKCLRNFSPLILLNR